MSSIKSINNEYNSIVKDLMFIEINKDEKPFEFINKSIAVPIYNETISKNNSMKTIGIKLVDAFIGIGIFLYNNELNIYKEFINTMLGKISLKDIIQSSITNNSILNYIILTGYVNNIEYINHTVEDKLELLDSLTISERYMLENYDIKEKNNVINNYKAQINELYELTESGKYLYYLGKAYEAENDFLRARLIYKKGIDEIDRENIDEDIKDALVNSYNEIYEISEMDRISYLLSYNKYNEALELINKLSESKNKTKLKLHALYCLNDMENVLLELDRYEKEHGYDEELAAFRDAIN